METIDKARLEHLEKLNEINQELIKVLETRIEILEMRNEEQRNKILELLEYKEV